MRRARIASVATVVLSLIVLQTTTGCSGDSGRPDAAATGPAPSALPAEELVPQIIASLQASDAEPEPEVAASSAQVLEDGAAPQDGAAPADGAAPTDGTASQDAAAQATISTPWGPLSPADRDLVVKVRLAGLWEIPTGRQAARRGFRAVTRKNLGEIARQHELLDAEVRDVAAQLRVPLPDEPNEDQKGWMAEISAKKGLAYDELAVTRLRLAHGKIFPAIGAVRASTQNTLIRGFAESAAKFVNTHMGLLEGTGLAGDHALPPAPTVSAVPSTVPSGEPAPSAPPATSLLDDIEESHHSTDAQ
ncbi:DUF4142 domain-containing protein [Sphaerisporangium sp. TRM90804]|uniref:DUF4142 domain-containing protein n=1 Tax=Sphaerisporangium sp. TRM90804 TaxID=3031113 RepID=UPI002447F726|nr:DUF4142 domain-containing protein [Sphaerisporangium sp. TRM90804]MDH2429639.1 DUF4142 domain-containing protein [Sphaerisporangium sp. TRM90804]